MRPKTHTPRFYIAYRAHGGTARGAYSTGCAVGRAPRWAALHCRVCVPPSGTPAGIPCVKLEVVIPTFQFA